jgi:2-oxoisovalerate dehydrogenase E2 component (dihydrolipoyl transacylase)
LLADIGEGIKECEIKQWFVKEGDTINEFDPVCQVESDKASVDITSRFAGKVKKLYFKVGEMASVGKPLIDIEVADAAGQTTKAAEPAKAAEQKQTSQIQNKTDSHENNGEYKTFATPAVRRIAKENNINLEDVQGTGKDGRITKEDVLNFVQNGKKPAVSGKPSAAAPSPIPMKSSTPPSSAPSVPSRTFQTSGSKGERREQVKGFKKAMVKTMNEAWRTIPHFGYCDEITMNDLIN